MPMPLDHINIYLLRDHDGWVVVDTGLNTAATRDMWELVARDTLQGLPIKAILCTHFHYDHAGLAYWLMERFQVPLYMTYGEYYMMRATYVALPKVMQPEFGIFLTRTGLPEEKIRHIYTTLSNDAFVSSSAQSFRRLQGGQILRIGERSWRVVIGAGHSPEHACLYCEDEQILISGDQLLPRISSNVLVTSVEPEGNPLQHWFDSLDRLDGLAPQTLILPSHQRVFRGLRTRVKELREHHAQQLDQLRAFITEAESCSAFEAMNILFPVLRGAVDKFLALGETIAHLSWLRFAGDIQRITDQGGIHRFSIAGPGHRIENKGIRCD